MNAIEVNGLSIGYNNVEVIKDSSFKVTEGSFTYLLGRNGSGKSTLIKALLGIIKPLQGTIRIMDQPQTQMLVAKYCGYLPQYAQVDRSFPITVEEIIELECLDNKSCPLGVSGHLKMLDGEHLASRPIRGLSGGELQKVLIARALVSDPSILILDEPMNNLDHASQQTFFELLLHLNREQHKTVIVITHDHNLVRQSEDEILLIHQYQVVTGHAEELIAEHFSNYGLK